MKPEQENKRVGIPGFCRWCKKQNLTWKIDPKTHRWVLLEKDGSKHQHQPQMELDE